MSPRHSLNVILALLLVAGTGCAHGAKKSEAPASHAGVTSAASAPTAAGGASTAGGDGFVDRFDVKKSDFASTGRNDYFILEPGYQHVYEGKEDDEDAKLIISVLPDTKIVDGVET